MQRLLKSVLLLAMLVLQAVSCTPIDEITSIDNQRLQQLLDDGVPLIDIRTPREWQSTGVISGSRLLTYSRRDSGSWLTQLQKIASPKQPVILICASGGRSSSAAKLLVRRAGFQAVYNARQGINGWLKAGRPVAKLEARPPR